MRITVNLPEKLGDSLKRTALQERISVSRLVTGAVEDFLLEKRRRTLGKKVLGLVGRARVVPEALELLDAGREDDRA